MGRRGFLLESSGRSKPRASAVSLGCRISHRNRVGMADVSCHHDLVMGRVTAKLPKFVSGYHHNGRECAPTRALAGSAMTNQLRNRLLRALAPNALTHAASRTNHE